MEKHLDSPSCKIIGAILIMDKRRTKTNELNNKKVDDHTQDLTPERCHRLYVSRKERGRGPTSIEISIDASIRGLKDYITNSTKRLTTAASNSTNNIRINRTVKTWNQEWKEKQLYGSFKQLTGEISHAKTRPKLRKGILKRETKYLVIAAENNAIRTNYLFSLVSLF